MNILMVHPHDLFDSSEPWTVRIKHIAVELSRKSNNVKICHFPLAIKRKHEPKEFEGIKVIPFDRSPSPASFIRNTLSLIQLARWADVVHFQKCHHYSSLPSLIAAFVCGKPLHYDWDDWEEKIWFESCGYGPRSLFVGLLFKVLERFLPVFSDTVSGASHHLMSLAAKRGKREEDIFFTPVGADLEKFRPGIDGSPVRTRYGISGPLVLYIGQLHGAQHVDLFIDAASHILSRRPEVKFMIVGEGFLERSLKSKVRGMNLDKSVIFTGAVEHGRVPEFIAAADVCAAVFRKTLVTICKSPLKIAEYLASGKPVVTSNVGEIRYMAGGVSILVAPGDSHLLAKGIEEFLDNKELRESISYLARKRAEHRCSWEKTAENLLSAYRKSLLNYGKNIV